MKQTPEGHPILTSIIFDNTLETAVHAIARAAKKWHGIEIHEPAWRLDLAEDIIHPANGSPIPYTKLYTFTYLPEQALWAHKGLDETSVVNHFKDSHYVTKQHLHKEVDPASAHRLHPKKGADNV
jgi:hypothetical protein